MRRFCSHCHGDGFKPLPGRKWWQFWKVVDCVHCGGDGYAKPPADPMRDRDAPLSPPPPRKR